MKTVTIGTNTLIARSVTAGVVVSCVQNGKEIARSDPSGTREQRDVDVLAAVLDESCATVEVRPVTLAGRLFLSVLTTEN